MRALVAPDKFKGCLSAQEVAESIASGLTLSGVDSVTLPLADGGDGSVEAAVSAGFDRKQSVVRGGDNSRRTADFALDSSRTAVVEVANTCGLSTLQDGVLRPLTASTYGFGEAIRAAVGAGAQNIVLALGGSASTDGGIGMLAALGYEFLDTEGRVLEPSGENLRRIATVRGGRALDLSAVTLVMATDVTNTLLGPDGAARVYGPQKGANPNEIARLEAGLDHLVGVVTRCGWPAAGHMAQASGAGAAGGCGFGGMLLGASVVSGAEYFLDLLDFDRWHRDADIVVTGEGRIDDQTVHGKLPAVVARRASPTPTVAVAGQNALSGRSPFCGVFALQDLTSEDTYRNPALSRELLREVGYRIGEDLQARISN